MELVNIPHYQHDPYVSGILQSAMLYRAQIVLLHTQSPSMEQVDTLPETVQVRNRHFLFCVVRAFVDVEETH